MLQGERTSTLLKQHKRDTINACKKEVDSLNETELKALELQAQIEVAKAKTIEAQSGVKKVLFGTMIVGVSAAIFPFLSSYAEQITTRSTVAIEDARVSRSHLESLASEARSEDLQTRMVLADFYRHVAPTKDERDRWQQFHIFLTDKQDEIRAERVASISIVEGKSTDEEVISSRLALEAFQRYEAPQPEFNFRGQTGVFSEDILKLQSILREKGCPIRPDGLLGPETINCLSQYSALTPQEVFQALQFIEGPGMLGAELLGKDPKTSEEILSFLQENGIRRDPNSHFFRFLERYDVFR